ncbi:MAG: S-methyl-5-thioribose-1-phosphate isomerase [Bacteroidota bacterium]
MKLAKPVKTIQWNETEVELIDQTKLPGELVTRTCTTPEEVAEAIKTMQVRGAPAIGVIAAMGLVLAAVNSPAEDSEVVLKDMEQAYTLLKSTRPTAVNLFWGLDRIMRAARERSHLSAGDLKRYLSLEVQVMAQEDEEINRAIGRNGAALIPSRAKVLTHCNAGALATVAYGTALGVIRAAHEAGKRIHVWVDETRPLLQGARLTAWELKEAGIAMTLISDNMAAYFMGLGEVDMVIVGADRIASNGDVANKIGTYGLAVLCKEHKIPFYVAAPVSTIDPRIQNGSMIPIEERKTEEVTTIGGRRVAPEGITVANPAFDVTPSRYISGIITERGVLWPPYNKEIARLFAYQSPQG